jgi:hypothetical protein
MTAQPSPALSDGLQRFRDVLKEAGFTEHEVLVIERFTKVYVEAERLRAQIDELEEIPHELLHITEVWRYKEDRIKELKAQPGGKQ